MINYFPRYSNPPPDPPPNANVHIRLWATLGGTPPDPPPNANVHIRLWVTLGVWGWCWFWGGSGGPRAVSMDCSELEELRNEHGLAQITNSARRSARFTPPGDKSSAKSA